MDAYESSLGPGGEDRHEGHPENSEQAAEKDAGNGAEIMERLPRTRPKRAQTTRGKAARTRAGGTPKAPRAKAGTRRQATRSAATRPRSRSRRCNA